MSTVESRWYAYCLAVAKAMGRPLGCAVIAAMLLSLPAFGQTITPQGRLTLTTGVPVMTTDATAQTTVYYDCYAGNNVPVAGTNLTITNCEVSMGLDAGTPHVASGSVYDIFAVNVSSAPALCVGPAWTSTTARGTGAGTTELQLSNGLWTNKNSLTNCWGGASGTTDRGAVSANAGTYLGSLYATANGQTGMQFSPTAAGGGTNNVLALYNAYNRTLIRSMSIDNGGSYTYATNTWRAARASNSNRINWLDGLKQSWVSASYVPCAQAGTNGAGSGVDFDSTSATPGGIIGNLNATASTMIPAGDMTILLGWHYAQAMEKSNSGTMTVVGNSPGLSIALMN